MAGTSLSRAASALRRLRGGMGDLWWYTLLMFLVQRMGEAINLFIGIFLVPKFLPASELGAVTPLLSVASFVGFPIAIALLPVGKFLNVFAARKEYGKVKALLSDAIALSLLFAVGVAIWLFSSGDGILERMHVTDRRIFIPIAAAAVLTCITPILDSAQRALKCFKGMVVSGIAAPYVRLAAMLLLLAPFGAFGYLSAQVLTTLSGALIGCVVLWLVFRRLGPRQSYAANLREMAVYAAPLLALTLASRIQAPIEAFVIRHRLPDEVTAGYYFSTIFGSIPGYMTSALTVVLYPIISEKFEKGESTDALFRQSMLFTFVVGALALAAVAAAAPFIFSLPGPWRDYPGYSRYVWQVGLLALLRSVQATFTTHESACRRFRYVWYLVPLYLLEAGVLYALPAWSLFRGFVPPVIWRAVDAVWAPSLQAFLSLTIFFHATFTLAMLIDAATGQRRRERAATPGANP